MIKGFNSALPASTAAAMNARWDEAVNAGMQVGRIQLDWAELEPAPGEFDETALLEPLEDLESDGLKPFVVLSTIDSGSYTLPADLSDPDDPTRLAGGAAINDPAILRRFAALLDWLVPHITAHGAWVLAVGNEPGSLIEDEPGQGDGLVDFLREARAHAHTLAPELAITMTLNYDATQSGQSRHLDFLANSDVASMNYYAADAQGLFEHHANVIHHEIDDMLAMAGDKLLVLQELDAASGYEHRPSPMGASLQGQRLFFVTVFDRMRAEPRFRVAVIFQLVDWNPELVERLYSRPLLAAGVDPGYVERFAEALETTGLIRFTDGSSKPAWQVVLDEIAAHGARRH